ncbi:GrpB family protein [Methylobacter sp.]|uniref:GrpB family protein n=1 Tax=Methylobacter sp. TaxID=2051955 RepID=UPI003DA56FA5
MIGLKRHTVEVVEHNSTWASLAADACREIRYAGGDLIVAIQHVGSTSVPDLAAKPILDIAAGIINLESIPELIRCLTRVGYIYRGDSGDEGGHLFVKESAPDIRIIHLHAMCYEGNQWRNYLAFRDLLRGNAVIRKQYADLKMELVGRFGQDRASYTESKSLFIAEALRSVQYSTVQPIVSQPNKSFQPIAPKDGAPAE